MLTKSKSYYIPNIQEKIQELQDMSNEKRLEIFEEDFQSFKNKISALENAINSLPPEKSRAKEAYSGSPQLAKIKKKLEELSTRTARTERLINESSIQPIKTYFFIPLGAMFFETLIHSLCSTSELKNGDRKKWALGYKEESQSHMTFGSAIGWRLLNVLLWPKFIIRLTKILCKQIIDLTESLVKGLWNVLLVYLPKALLDLLKIKKYKEWNRLLEQLKSQIDRLKSQGVRWGLDTPGDSNFLFRIAKASVIFPLELLNLIFYPITAGGQWLNDHLEPLLTFDKEEAGVSTTDSDNKQSQVVFHGNLAEWGISEDDKPLPTVDIEDHAAEHSIEKLISLVSSTRKDETEISSGEESPESKESSRPNSPVSVGDSKEEKDMVSLTLGVSATDNKQSRIVVSHGELEKWGIFANHSHNTPGHKRSATEIPEQGKASQPSHKRTSSTN